MAQSCFACSSVVHQTHMPLASLLIPHSLMPEMEAFPTAHWHHSIISFEGNVSTNSFTSSFVSFNVNVASYFVRSCRRASHCCLCRGRIDTSGFGLNFVKFIYHFPIILHDFGLNIFMPLPEAHNTCLDVLQGIENYVFFIAVPHYLELQGFFKRCDLFFWVWLAEL